MSDGYAEFGSAYRKDLNRKKKVAGDIGRTFLDLVTAPARWLDENVVHSDTLLGNASTIKVDSSAVEHDKKTGETTVLFKGVRRKFTYDPWTKRMMIDLDGKMVPMEFGGGKE